jgi:glutathione synthase
MIENSLAIKCPTVAQQLAGTKKMQQVLTGEGMVERFLPEYPEQARQIRSCFTGIYALDAGTPEGDAAYAKALQFPDKYVLKPQREGGGNNLYGKEMVDLLTKMSQKERSAYVLMELIRPPSLRNVLVRGGVLSEAQVVSELGIYGIWVGNGDHIVVNQSGGHLLRTKAIGTNEGGVAAGFAVLDSPLLF